MIFPIQIGRETLTANIRADGVKQVFFQDQDDNWFEVNSVVSSNTRK